MRLRNVNSGAVVSCSEETAARLGGEWKPADDEPAKSRTPRKRAASRPASTNSD